MTETVRIGMVRVLTPSDLLAASGTWRTSLPKALIGTTVMTALFGAIGYVLATAAHATEESRIIASIIGAFVACILSAIESFTTVVINADELARTNPLDVLTKRIPLRSIDKAELSRGRQRVLKLYTHDGGVTRLAAMALS